MKAGVMAVALMLMSALAAWAIEPVTLSWSEVAGATGYRIYYSSEAPSTDVMRAEPGSPVDVPGETTATLSDLPANVYYFAATAYNDDGSESAFSNIVCTTWMPTLTYPANGATGVARDVELQWSRPAENPESYTYTVYYGPQGQEMAPAAVIPPINVGRLPKGAAPVLILAMVGGGLLLLARRYQVARGVAVCCMSALVLVSCSDGGSDYNASTSTDEPAATVLLEPNTTYNWKVVADNGTLISESQQGSFTTGSN